MHLGATPPYLCLWRRNFCAAGGVLLWLQRCNFWTVESLFSLTTAAQNIHVFLRKSPLCRNHFFGWSKTANSSTACGTVTLKSLLPQAFFTPHVHPRLRKCLSRCTLDCGFKTPESPALRGFVVGLRTLATAALYLVLLSNGFPYSKIRLKKFDFSPIDTPANIAKKLPSQRCSQPFLIAFSTSRTNGPRSLSRVKVGTHSALGERLHTTAHTAKHGAFRMGALLLPSERSTRFGNPAWPGFKTANFAAFGSWSETLLKNAESLRSSDALMRVAVPKASRPRWAA